MSAPEPLCGNPQTHVSHTYLSDGLQLRYCGGFIDPELTPEHCTNMMTHEPHAYGVHLWCGGTTVYEAAHHLKQEKDSPPENTYSDAVEEFRTYAGAYGVILARGLSIEEMVNAFHGMITDA